MALVRRLRRALAGGAALAAALGGFAGAGEAAVDLETAIKASYLYKFAPFIQWPQAAFTTPSEPITICVAGRDPFGPALEEAIRGQRVSGRTIVVRYLENVEPETRCHILFAGEAPEQSVQEALRAVAGRPVLTVTDLSRGVGGGMIQFVVVRGRVRFTIDAGAAGETGLAISSKLLALAVTVGR